MESNLSLSGIWRMRPLDYGTVRKYTSLFSDNGEMEIDTQNSIYTTLVTRGGVEESVRFLSNLFWIVKRKFSLDIKNGERAIVKVPSAYLILINGKKAEGREITNLLKNGENEIELIVSSSFRGNASISVSKEGVLDYISTKTKQAEGGKWNLSFRFKYFSFRKQTLPLEIRFLSKEIKTSFELEEGYQSFEYSLAIEEKVDAWNIRGDGKQKSYPSSIKLGNTVFEKNISFRDVNLVKDALYLNGRRLFHMGAIWPKGIAADRRRYEMLLSSACDANMNVIAIEEGHEGHMFYNIADRLGILILHREKNEEFSDHPSYVYADLDKLKIYTAKKDGDDYRSKCINAINLERWVLKSRSSNETRGVLYDDLFSTVTEDGKWKPSHYGARRFFSDLVPIMYIEDGKLRIFASNDSAEDTDMDISVKFMRYDGEKRKKYMHSISVPAHSHAEVRTVDLSKVDVKNEFVYVKLRTADVHRELSLLLAPIEECAFRNPNLNVTVNKAGSSSYSFRVKCAKPAFAVTLDIEGIAGKFSDNFFEVRPSGEKMVLFTPYEETDIDTIISRLRVYDIYSSWKKEENC